MSGKPCGPLGHTMRPHIRNQLHAPVDVGGTAGAMAEPWLLGASSFQVAEPMVESQGAGGQASQ